MYIFIWYCQFILSNSIQLDCPGQEGQSLQWSSKECQVLKSEMEPLAEGGGNGDNGTDAMEFAGHTISIPDCPTQLDDKDPSSILDSNLFTVIGSDSDLPDSLHDFVFSASALAPAEPVEDTTTPTEKAAEKVFLVPGSRIPLHSVHTTPLNANSNNVQYFTIGSSQYQNLQVNQNLVPKSNTLRTKVEKDIFQLESLEDGTVPTSPSPILSHASIEQNNILLPVQPCPSSDMDSFGQFSPSGADYTVPELALKAENLGSSDLPVDLPSNSLSGIGDSSNDMTMTLFRRDNGELGLNSLPNFLGLENSTPPLINTILEKQSLDMLESPISSLPSSEQHTLVKNEFSSESQPPIPSNLSTSDINITTISISNDDENATKILVNTNQGEPQMYVINTAGLAPPRQTTVMPGQNPQQHLYVIQASGIYMIFIFFN